MIETVIAGALLYIGWHVADYVRIFIIVYANLPKDKRS